MSKLFHSLRGNLPNSDRWGSVFLLLLGGLLGLLRYPLVLVAFGPFRWLTALYAMSAQESRFGALPVGDDGYSTGMLHFNVNNPLVSEASTDWRDSAFWQGWYACAYISRALTLNWRWWGLAVPGLGFAVLRWVWTHGAGDSSAAAMTSGDSQGYNLWTYQPTQSIAWQVWLPARALSVAGLTAPVAFVVGRLLWWRK